MLNWSEITQRVVIALAVILCVSVLTYTTTRAGTEEVEALAKQHAEDIKASEEADVELAATIRDVDGKLTSIAVVLDRMDKKAGGPGMPAETLRRSP